MNDIQPFRPNWTSAPGDTIADILHTKQLSRLELSAEASLSLDEIDDLLDGRVAITLSVARSLSTALGASPEFWLSRDLQYRQALIRANKADREWLSELPLRDMIKFGWIESAPLPSEELSTCLQFFDVRDVSEWWRTYAKLKNVVAFRASPTFDSRLGSTAAWLRQGELMASRIECKKWNVETFYNSLSRIRKLTRQKNPQVFLPELQSICAASGVACVVVRSPRGCAASGATRFVADDKALLQFSFRYLTDDHFWFTFFHEAGHLIVHGENMIFSQTLQDNGPWILEGIGGYDPKEEEANAFAASYLIPSKFNEHLTDMETNRRTIVKLATEIGVSPGIVVGQLQHRGRIPYDQMNGLKRRYSWEL
ncbi:MAG: ImmA/IrrE family metallo-endopeptidase [Chloroflexi bacterium]|nr:ImmA/IrrE family metallo-endopeptidase [Chloroflexota bacterium]